MELIGDIWNLIVIQPMINSLVLIYSFVGSNFGISIIVFTIIVRLILIPMTIKQSRQMKMMSSLQPKLKEIQNRYPKDKAKTSSETMKIYREHGVSPMGCLGPMFIQFPIWIGLYQAILQTVPSTPESLIGLSRHLYSWLPQVHEVIPLNSNFLWLNLGLGDPLVMPIMVAASMWVMQKMTMMPSVDPKQASTNRMMLWMMPLMFGFFTTTFPSGLALYWVVSNIVGVLIQGCVTGWEPLTSMSTFGRAKEEPAAAAALVPTDEEKAPDERDRDDSQDDRGSNRNRSKGARRRSRRGRSRRR